MTGLTYRFGSSSLVSLAVFAAAVSGACASRSSTGGIDPGAQHNEDMTPDSGDPVDSSTTPDGSISASDGETNHPPEGSYITGTLTENASTKIQLDPPATVDTTIVYSCGTTNYEGNYGVSIGWTPTDTPSVGTYQAMNHQGVLVMVFLPSGAFSTTNATVNFTTADATHMVFEGTVTGLSVSFPDEGKSITAAKLEFHCEM